MKNALVRSVFASRTVPVVKVARKMKNARNVVKKTLKIVVTIIISITSSNIGITQTGRLLWKALLTAILKRHFEDDKAPLRPPQSGS